MLVLQLCTPHTYEAVISGHYSCSGQHVFIGLSSCDALNYPRSARGYIYLIGTDREYINTLQWCMAEWLLANGTQDMLCVWCARVCARGHVRKDREMCVYMHR